MIEDVLDFIESKGYQLLFYACAVQAGFPSPTDDYMEGKLDLNKHLVKHPTATFFVKVAGDSMIKARIYPGDVLVVDQSLEAKHGKIVIAAVDDQLTVKRLNKKGKETYLMPENDDFEPIKLSEGNEIVIWGIVTNVLNAVYIKILFILELNKEIELWY